MGGKVLVKRFIMLMAIAASANAIEPGASSNSATPLIPSIRSQSSSGTIPAGKAASDKKKNVESPRAVAKPDTVGGPEIKKTPPEQTEFQRFVQASSGKLLPIYGSELFDFPDTFAPVDDIPVTTDYVIGPGDELLLRGWGQLDLDLQAVVDRNGMIFIPKVGNIRVAGLKYQELNGYLKTAIGRVFRNFDLNVNLGQLRSIRVFVLGYASRPGSYTVNSLSTLVNTLFAAGGPSVSGSMRSIQLKRGNQVITELDLYDLLLKGDKSRDVHLLPGDVIHIPAVGPQVAILGSVIQPAIYELKGASKLADLLDWSGGVSSVANGQKLTVERIDRGAARSIDEFTLDPAGLAQSLKNGDVITAYPLSPRFDNVITLRGHVAQPSRVPWRQGMRVLDLIPNKTMLVTPEFWRDSIGIKMVNEKLGDKDTDPDMDPAGRSDTPGVVEDSVNWDYATIERMDWNTLKRTLIPFDLGRAVLARDPEANLVLEPGDAVTIYSATAMLTPISRQTRYVKLEGEFARPGLYTARAGETLRQFIERIGGLSPNAYLYGAKFTRESTREQQQKQYENILNRMEQEFEQAANKRARNALSAEDISGIQYENDYQRERFKKLHELRPEGRVVMELPLGSTKLADLPDIPLENGDKLTIPPMPSIVSVYGAVQNESSFIHRSEKRLEDYLSQAGGPTQYGETDRMFVLRADGSVVSNSSSSWLFNSIDNLRLMPGDSIVVPENNDKQSWVKSFKDWTQILYQFGLGVAAWKVLTD